MLTDLPWNCPAQVASPSGFAPSIQYEKKSITLLPNDIILLYSDGVTEAENAEGEQFGMERLQQMVASSTSRHPRDLTHAVFDAVHAFCR